MPKIHLKLDENFGPNLTFIFRDAGFDTHSVLDENLSGEPDTVIYRQCLAENRCLITFDTDFCNILRFPADNTAGIIVIRPNRRITLSDVQHFAHVIIELLNKNNPKSCLWIVDSNKLRIRRPDNI
jgi:predicted nuclease of predicted toxin-antitoxin system